MVNPEDERPLSQIDPDDQQHSRTDSRSAASSRASSTEIEQRVRFSQDLGDSFGGSAGNRRSGANSGRSSPGLQQGLTVGTPPHSHGSNRRSLSPSSSSAAQNPLFSGSQTSRQAENAHENGGSTSPTSPSTTNRRSRGYSLRRQLFFRNTSDREENSQDTNGMTAHGTSGSGGGESTRGNARGSAGIELNSIKPLTPETDALQKKNQGGKVGSAGTARSRAQNPKDGTHGKRPVLHTVKSVFTSVKNIVLHIQEIPPSKDGRKIPLTVCTNRKSHLTDERTGGHYMDKYASFISSYLRERKKRMFYTLI